MIKGAVMNEHKKHGSSFSSKMGFILAAAGSAVGLGNLWRFPYLAAKYGGGSFLLIYVILAVTFGFALMITEIALGRKTGKSALYAFSTLPSVCTELLKKTYRDADHVIFAPKASPQSRMNRS
mgnify:CR=1 FL=1